MTEVASAGGAFDLDAHAVGVRKPADPAGDLLIEGWPATVGVELGV